MCGRPSWSWVVEGIYRIICIATFLELITFHTSLSIKKISCLKAFLPTTINLDVAGNFPGLTKLTNVTPGQGVGIELFITFVLVLVVFAAAADENNSASVKGSAPLAIGLSITTCHLYAVNCKSVTVNLLIN